MNSNSARLYVTDALPGTYQASNSVERVFKLRTGNKRRVRNSPRPRQEPD